MPEQISDLGYLGLKKEATKGTPIIPTIFLPIYGETITEDQNIQDIDPIMGLKVKRYDTLRGQRAFKGNIEFLGEPNTAGYVLDMLLNKVSTSGSNPYTHVFALNSTNPNSYTIDIARGRMVYRYWGVEASELSPAFDENRMRLVAGVTALGCAGPREITNVASTTLTLSSAYDAVPTKGFIATDPVRIFLAGGTVVDTTISSVTNTTIVVASAGAAATGDIIALRPATPTYSLVDFFQWAKTEARFGTAIAGALSATHTAIEKGSDWKIIHEMLPEGGALRSGAYDPVSIIRGRGDIEAKTKIFFDLPDDKNKFYMMTDRALIFRHFAGSTNQYELRVTLNQAIMMANPTNLKVGDVLFNDINWKGEYDTTDTANMAVSVLNAVATI